MTYDLSIGKLVKVTDPDEGYEYPDIEGNEHPLAPAYPGSALSKHTGFLSIGWFGGYRNFDSAIRTYDCDLAGVLCTGNNDYAVIPITEELAQRIARVLIQYKVDNPDAEPGFEEPSLTRAANLGREVYDLYDLDATLARLEILNWWVQYSLEQYGPDAAIRIS